MASQAEKRRKKQHARAIKSMAGFDLAPVPRREKNGCFTERTRQQAEPDPRDTVLRSRSRRLGMTPTKKADNDMASAMLSDDAGIAIYLGEKDTARRSALWQTFCDLDRADATYHARVLGQGRFAKCGKIEYFPERFEARPDESNDLRTDDEKHRDAVNSWMMWHGRVMMMAVKLQAAVWAAVYMRRTLHQYGHLTDAGRDFIVAINRLTDIASARRGAAS